MYELLNTYIDTIQSKKLSVNSTALIHASSTSILGLLSNIVNNEQIMRFNTCGYFIFDLLYILRNRKIKLLQGMYIYHHIVGYYYMTLDPMIYNWQQVIAWGEFSNIPSYFVYYYLKKSKETFTDKKCVLHYQNNLKLWKKIQLIVYTIVRGGVLSFLTYKELQIPEKRAKLYPVTGLYVMSLVWMLAIIQKNI